MKKTFLNPLAALLLAGALSMPVMAADVDGVEIADSLEANGTELTLNGAGTRSKWFIDLYVGGLYLESANRDAGAVLVADEPQAIGLTITSGRINSDNMTEATLEGFEASTDGNTAPIQDEIDALMTVFESEISEGDVFDLIYLPGNGVQVYKNGDAVGEPVGGLDFKRALFGIWLSDSPVQDSLKAGMLDSD